MVTLRLCCSLLGFISIASSQTFFQIPHQEQVVRLGEFCLVAEDPDRILTPERVFSPQFLPRFQRSTHKILNFGFTTSTYWMRLDLWNTSDETSFVIGVNNPLLDEIEFFVRDPRGKIHTFHAGLEIQNSRGSSRTPAVDVNIGRNDSVTVLCRARSSTALVIPLTLWVEEGFRQNSRDEILILGMYYGILFVLIAYNILLFFSMKEVIYLEYSGLIFCYALSQFTFDGFLSLYVPGLPSWLLGHIFPVTFALMIVIAHSLTQRLLGTKTHAPQHHRMMNGIIILGSFWVVMVVVLPLRISHPVTPVLTTAAVLLLLLPAFLRWKQGYQPARPFIVAIIALSIALLVRMFRHVGILTDIALTVHPVHVGSLVDAILLSISLSDRINLRKIEDEVGKIQLRDRLARDLHDDLASTLGSISLFASSLTAQLKRPTKEAKELLERISTLALDSVDAIGDIVWSVSPERDTLQQLLIRMKDFSSQICTANNIHYSLRMERGEEDLVLDPGVRRHLYLIFKEAVNNVVRHSEAVALTVEARLEGHSFELRIRDNGRGFQTGERRERGHGLRSMKKRAREIGATLRIESSARGTLVSLSRRMT